MAVLNLCISFLVLCMAGISLQGGTKPQRNGRVGLYLPSYIRGVMQPGPGLGPAGVKAGRYPTYRTQGLPAGLGYGVSPGYGIGYRGFGYPYVGLPFGVLGPRSKPSKSAGYGVGPSAGVYQGTGIQQGYGAGGNGFPSTGPQPNGYGAQTYYGTQLGGSAMDPTAAKYKGQLSYGGQPKQPEAEGLGGDYSAGRYDNGNGLGYTNGDDSQTNGLGAAGAYVPLATGKVPGRYGPGQGLGSFGGKEPNYRGNGFLGNRYRVHCASGKC